MVTPAITNLIRENKIVPYRLGDPDRQEVRHAVAGRPPLVSCTAKGMISAEEMIDIEQNPGDLRDKVHNLGRTVGRRSGIWTTGDMGDAEGVVRGSGWGRFRPRDC